MLIGLTGYARSGKDTVANYLVSDYGFVRIGFADKLKELAVMIDPDLDSLVKVLGWETAKQVPKYRKFLQDLGNSARLVLNENIWINKVFEQIGLRNIVISDARYLNEFEAIQAVGGKVIRINRNDVGPVNDHITETGHGNFSTDFVVYNNGVFLGELYDAVDDVMLVLRGARKQ